MATKFFAKTYFDQSLMLASEPMRYFSSLVALDLAFQSIMRWTLNDQSRFVTSLITGDAPSKIIVAKIKECMDACVEGSKDWEYFKEWADKGFDWISIDGNNRTITVDQYLKGEVPIVHGEYSFPCGVFIINSKNDTYDKHPKAMRQWIEDNIRLTVTEYHSATRADLSTIFINVNYGVKLNDQELRNAILVTFAVWVRNMSVKYEHVFDLILKDNKRRAYDKYVLQLAVFSAFGFQQEITNSVLNAAYEDDSSVSRQTKKFEETMELMSKLVKKYAGKEFKKNVATSLYLLLDHMRKEKIAITDQEKFYKWFIASENRRLGNAKPIMKTPGGEFRNYESTCKTWSLNEMTARFDKIMEDFNHIDDGIVSKKDPVRIFSKTQRYEMWIRQGGICTVTGEEIPEEQINDDSLWHADHIVPFSKGGKTTVMNGQLISREANLKKSNKLELAEA